MSAYTAFIAFRVLVVTTDQDSPFTQAIRARFPHLTVITVNTSMALDTAVTDGHYDAVCLQYPTPWSTSPSAAEVLRQWLPALPDAPIWPPKPSMDAKTFGRHGYRRPTATLG